MTRAAPGAGPRAALPAGWRLLLFAVAAVVALAPALRRPTAFSWRYDWRYFEAMGEASRRAVLFFHQAPLWNPYSCGGEVALANPQSLDFAPSFPLVLLLGVALGYKVALVLYHAIALEGTYRLARRFGASDVGSLLAGFAYGLSGWMALHFSEGHVTFLGVTFYPWLLLCFERALDETEWVVPTGLCAAAVLALGGTFTPPMAAELLLLWALLRAVERRSARPLLLLLPAGAVALGVLAIRMLPVLEFVRDHPRPPFMRATDALGPHHLLLDLVAWRELAPVAGRKYWAHEYTARLPWLLAPLWVAGLWLPWSRRHALPATTRGHARRLWLLTIAFAVLSMGNFSSLAPWSLLQRLPLLRDLRVPSRHMVLVTLGLAPLCGLAWDHVTGWLRARRPAVDRWLRLASPAMVALVACDAAAFTAWQYRDVFTTRLAVPAAAPPFYQVHGSWRVMRETIFAGQGSIDTPGSKDGPGCDEEAPLQRADALDAGDVPQERLLDPSAGDVVSSVYSPNARTVTVELRAPTTLLVNSNWNEHWRVSGATGARVLRVAGRLAVDLRETPAGRHTLVLRYAPRSFTAGAITTAVALPLCLAVFFLVRRHRRAPVATAPRAS